MSVLESDKKSEDFNQDKAEPKKPIKKKWYEGINEFIESLLDLITWYK